MRPQADVDRLIRARLEENSRRYAAALPEGVGRVRDAWMEILARANDPAAVDSFYRLVHDLAGSGATFGFPLVSEIARDLERLIAPLRDGVANDTRLQGLVVDLLDRLGGCIQDEATPGWIDLALPARPEKAPRGKGKRILLVEEDTQFAGGLARELAHFGYAVTQIDDPLGLSAALERLRPAALVAGTSFFSDPLYGVAAVKDLPGVGGDGIPVIFLSERQDIDARLAAVRAGGDDYLVRPFDPLGLVERLDRLTETEQVEPYRILIVDDDGGLAQHYASVLEAAGMAVTTLDDPRQVFGALAEAAPELILLDLYLPHCSGLELAKLIRQEDAFTGVPIVFLSTETSIDRQLLAMSLGGDDFLTKPIQPAHLVASVVSRVRRGRLIRSMMSRDSLTGLLNHAHLLDQLDTELSRELRSDGKLAFALLDLDHFKQINDRHGHPAGDRVITNLSRLLKQRLRKSDIVGRYGGEEFGIILPGTGAGEAAKVVDNLRRAFRAISHETGGETYHVSFSCGIAAWPGFDSASAVTDAADRALYLAKQGGRDRVVILPGLSPEPDR